MDIDHPKIWILATDSVRRAISRIDGNQAKIALVVDDQGRLVDTITDGDVRRGILAGSDLDRPVSELMDQKRTLDGTVGPVSALVGTNDSELLELMQSHQVRQVPLVDAENRVVGLVRLLDLLPPDSRSVDAIVMAGGYGTRLQPLTNDLPKPMLPMGEQPLLENIINQLRDAGIQQVNLATHFQQDIIFEHFGDGAKFGVAINYVQEDQPLGTAGALGLLETPEKPLLVINGDILTQVDFQAMIDFHCEHKAEMTVGVRLHELRIPYGVVESDGFAVTNISEKPVIRHFINAGIYLLNPGLCRFVPAGEHYDMTDLILKLLAEGIPVASFPVREYWVDIGTLDDYQQALAYMNSKKAGLAS